MRLTSERSSFCRLSPSSPAQAVSLTLVRPGLLSLMWPSLLQCHPPSTLVSQRTALPTLCSVPFYSTPAIWQPLASRSSLYLPNLLLAKKMARLQKSNSVLISAVSLRSQGLQKVLGMVFQVSPGPAAFPSAPNMSQALSKQAHNSCLCPYTFVSGDICQDVWGMSRGCVVSVGCICMCVGGRVCICMWV